MGKFCSQVRGGWLGAGRVPRIGVRAVLPLAAAILCLVCCAAAAAQPPPPAGGLNQLAGSAGCVSATGNNGACGFGLALDGAESSVVSPDGHNLYVGSYKVGGLEPGVSIFSRDPPSGRLLQLSGTAGCLTADGASQLGINTCTAVRGLQSVGDGRDIALTSDGLWAYMVGQGGSGARPTIMAFSRDPNIGSLAQLPGTAGCISDDGSSQAGPNTCATNGTLLRPSGVTISPDDGFVYVTDYGTPSGVKAFSRNLTTGALTPVQCVEVHPAAAGCSTAREVGDANSFAISSDGKHAYSADMNGNGLSIFDRDPSTGLLTQKTGTAGCISANGNDDTGASTCALANGLNGAYSLTLSPNGQSLYVSSTTDAGIAIFHVAGDGTLAELPGTAACITLDGKSGGVAGKCAVGRGLALPYQPTISPNGSFLYVPSKAPTEGGIAIFTLDPSTGRAVQLPGQAGCITADGGSGGTPGLCTTGTAVAGGSSIAFDPSGGFAYLAAYNARAIAVFQTQGLPSCAPLNVPATYLKPVTIPLGCVGSDGEPILRTIVSQPAEGTLGPIDQANGTVVYTPSASFTRSDSFTFAATDGTNTSGATPIAIHAAGPRLTQVTQKRTAWHRSTGTTFKFNLDEAATVTFTFEEPQPGRRLNGVCEPLGPLNAGHRHCTYYNPVGKLRINGHPGNNKVVFKGRLRNGRRLRTGSYKVWVVADNLAGSSRAKLLQFEIL